MKIEQLPKKIAVFPLSNFIIFPKTTVPLNIFEPRYIDMINNSMKSDKLIGMIQPKNSNNQENIQELHNIGCLGKITSFQETEDNRYLIELKGLVRFQTVKEIKSKFQYREFEILTALRNLITDNVAIKNRYGLISYVKEDNDIYFLVDSLTSGAN